MADYEAVLRRVEEAREQAQLQNAKQKEKYIMTYENDDADNMQTNEDEDEIDDLDLDDAELEAYLRLKEANSKISALEKQKEEPNKVANLLLRSTKRVYNDKGLTQKLQDIQVTTTSPWVEYVNLTSPQPLALADPDDQVERELKFYEQALISVQEGLQKLNNEGVKTERPDDFFAEMVKSDSHMLKVKATLLENQKVIEKREDNRKRREMKKIGKQLRANKLREKIEEKKANLKLVEYWRKQHGGKGKEFDLQQFEESVKKMQAERMQKYHETQQTKTTGKLPKSAKKTGAGAGAAANKKRPGKKQRQSGNKRK